MNNKYSIFNRRSLFWKIYLSMILVLFLPIAIFHVHGLFMDYTKKDRETRSEVVKQLQWSAKLLADQAESLPDAKLPAWMADIRQDMGLELIVRKNGQTFIPPDSGWASQYLAGELPPPPRGPLHVEALSQSGATEAVVLLFLRPPPPPGGMAVRNVAFVTIALLGIVIAFLIVRSYINPLMELRKVTAKLAEGDFSVRAGERVLSHGEEIADLGASFNWMAECVENVVNSQKRLLVDISHELRSPLQRMDVALTLARKGADRGLEQYLDRVELEIGRINEMVDELLTLTRAQTIEKPPENVRLDEILNDIAIDGEFAGQLQGKKIVTDIERISVLGDAALLKRAFGNVVQNAIRHAPPESDILIGAHCSEDGREAVVTIRDFGPGVPEEELENIFKPYYRVDAARERAHGGTGLGLSISKRVAEGHGGRIRAANGPGGGLLVTIVIPM